MGYSKDSQKPYLILGSKLKMQRELMKKSLEEVADAVEINEDQLSRIEQGQDRPSEDILMLLFNHFNTKEDEAIRLWEMAGYSKDQLSDSDDDDEEDNEYGDTNKQIHKIMMTVAMDPRVIYSDSVQVTASSNGVVLNFMQPGVGNLQPMSVSRVGMSLDQAKALEKLLGETVKHIKQPGKQEPRQLPPSSGQSDSSKS